jgi:YhcH/YjgK/YiaL family protein
MLYVNEKDFSKCKELSANIVNDIISFIKNNDLKAIDCGRYDINEDLYVNIFESTTKEDDGVFEEHREYIDIHYLINGTEIIKYETKDNFESLSEYDTKDDYQLFRVNTDKCLQMNEGDFAIFFTKEKHKPSLTNNSPCKIKKAVFKLKK